MHGKLAFVTGIFLMLIYAVSAYVGDTWFTFKVLIVFVWCFLVTQIREPGHNLKSLLFIPGVIFAASIILYTLENIHYDNYIFSSLHVFLRQFALLAGAGFSIILILSDSRYKSSFLSLLIAFYFVQYLTSGVSEIAGKSAAQVIVAIRDSKQNHDQKLLDKFGNVYNFIRFVKANTDSGSKILIPPSPNPWRYTGDHLFMGALLYPRLAFNTSTDPYIRNKNIASYDYIIISSEESPDHKKTFAIWPDFTVAAEKIVIYKFDEEKPQVLNGVNYDPEVWSKQKAWGYIVPKTI